MADAFSRGAELYRDVADTNPPLIVLLNLPPVWASHISGWPVVWCFRAWVSALSLVSLTAASCLIESGWADTPVLVRRTLVTVLVFALFPLVGGDFGQREHLALILSLPWLLLSVGRFAGAQYTTATGLVVGVCAGVGLSLKPQLFAALILVEAGYTIRRPACKPWRRPETLGVASVIVMYVVGTVLFLPSFWVTFATVRTLYPRLNPPLSYVIRVADLPVWASAAAVFALVRVRSSDAARLGAVLLIGFGFLVAAVGQLKGWTYHFYPARSVLWLFTSATLLAATLDPRLAERQKGLSSLVARLIVVGLLAASAHYAFEARRSPAADEVTPLLDLVKREARNRPMFLMSTALVYPAFPLVIYAGAGWSSRHNSLWFLRAEYADEFNAGFGEVAFRRPAQMPALERRLFNEVIDDLCRTPPALLIVETPMRRRPHGSSRLDFLAYYSQSARFSRLFAHYAESARVRNFTIFKAGERRACD